MRVIHYALTALFTAGLSAGAAAAAETPVKGGTLLWGLSSEAGTMDCGGTDTFAVIHTVGSFYSKLLQVDLDNYPKVKGDLAKSWKISEDGKTYTFDLHDNVKFTDGTPLTSADVKASYDRYRTPPEGVASFRKASFADIESIEAPSPTQVVFKLKAANPAMLLNLASPHGCIYSAKKLAEDPKFPIANVLGSGPFKLVEYVRGSHVTAVRNENYFKPGLPYLDGYKAIVFTQSSAMVNALQGGQIHGEFRFISPADKKRLQEAMGDKIKFYEMDSSTGMQIVFNTKRPPFNDIRVRQALSMAVDRFGGSMGMRNTTIMRGIGTFIRPGAPFATDEKSLSALPGFGKDIKAAREKAKELLKEAGVTNLKFEVLNRATNQPYTPAGVYLVDQWRQIGVEVTHKQVETPAYREGIRSNNFDVAIDFNNSVLEDPSLTLTKYLSADRSPENGTGFIDREADALFDKQSREADPKKREDLVRQFEARVITQGAQVPYIWWFRTVALSSRIHGWKLSPSHLLGQDLADIWLEAEK